MMSLALREICGGELAPGPAVLQPRSTSLTSLGFPGSGGFAYRADFLSNKYPGFIFAQEQQRRQRQGQAALLNNPAKRALFEPRLRWALQPPPIIWTGHNTAAGGVCFVASPFSVISAQTHSQ